MTDFLTNIAYEVSIIRAKWKTAILNKNENERMYYYVLLDMS